MLKNSSKIPESECGCKWLSKI